MIRYLFLVSCLLYGSFSKAQAPVGDFTANVTSGCSPVVVTYKDLSTGNPKFWNWDLGNGQLSSQQNPVAVYSTPGKYTVTLIVRNQDGTDGVTKKDFIVVNPSPAADFSADFTTACLPAVINFKDLSVPNAGVITKWQWDFGDGTTSTQRNPQKTYTSTGYYTVSLAVTSSTGCAGSGAKGRYIRVVSGVKAAFLDSIIPVCKTPVTVNFKNETSGPGQLSYNWSFGNGNNSAVADPSEAYAAAGKYNVRLIAKSEFGCSDTADGAITINNKLTNINAPDSACINQPVTLVNSNNSALESNWDFGDGSKSTVSNPVKTFPVPGTYTISLLNNYADCIDSAKKQLTVIDLPTVVFNSDKQISCKAPFAVNFQDSSPDAVAWSWDFGDGTSGTGKNAAHTYNRTGEFDVTLTITSKFGCQNKLKKSAFIKIIAPTVSITNAPSGGCIPFTFSPVAGVIAIDGVAGYAWNFGDGSTSTSATPSHTYTAVGNYDLRLTVTTTGGCTASVSVPSGVRTGTPAAVNFTIQKNVSCAFDSVQFNDLSNPADQWLWDFGDGTTSTARNPKHAFDSVGTFDITLTAFNNGCPVTVRKPAMISVTPPIARFSYKSDCNNRLVMRFVNESITDINQPTTYLWEFGDGAKTTSTARDTSFTYSKIGTYTVTLKITNGQCTNTISKQISLVSDVADFNVSKTALCKNEKVTLNAVNSNAANISEYVWKINGAAAVGGRSFETSFPASGVYDLALQITDINGCTDQKTVAGAITVTGPVASFLPVDDSACSNTTVTFTDASTPASSIAKWTFNFGDGNAQTFTKAPFTHIYKDTGRYQVLLTIEDKQGCSDASNFSPLVVTRPVAVFAAAETKLCPGSPVQFLDSSRGLSLTYAWDFGDGTTSTQAAPLHLYPLADKVYNVKLSVTDITGCSDSAVKLNYVDVRAPKSAFDIQDTITLCPPLETKFFFKAKDYESYYWDFGDGGTSQLQNPTHFYNSYGTFTAKLYVTGYGGCIDSSEHLVHVYNPYSSVIKYNPLESCNSLMVDFSITTPPGTSFQLYFTDGAFDETQRTTLQHFYSTPSLYTPYIVLKDSLDCQVAVGGAESIRVIGAEPFFSLDKKNFCDSGTVYFTNYTIGNDPVVSDTWDFGDGQTSSVKDPVHTYSAPGTYIVSHIVQTQNGCAKTITDTVRIYRTPVPSITAKDIICINGPELLQGLLTVADTSIKWEWSLGDGQQSGLQNVTHAYNAVGNYMLKMRATNLLGCYGETSKPITVAPLPLITVPQNPIISVGSEIKLPVTYSQNVITYNWAPPATLDCSNCPNPVATPKFTTTYKVNVTDSNSCKNNAEVVVSVICNEKNYFVPNTFSPNGDGVNDIFYPRGSGIDRVQSMRIFNRWGELVFEKKNFFVNSAADGWNGTFKGKPANGDVYVYIIEFVCDNANIVPFKGNIALIR